VDLFYRRVMDDPQLEPYFRSIDMSRQRHKLVGWWVDGWADGREGAGVGGRRPNAARLLFCLAHSPPQASFMPSSRHAHHPPSCSARPPGCFLPTQPLFFPPDPTLPAVFFHALHSGG